MSGSPTSKVWLGASALLGLVSPPLLLALGPPPADPPAVELVLEPEPPPGCWVEATVEPAGEPPLLEVPPTFRPEVSSLRLLRSAVVRSRPDVRADPIGTVAQDMRVGWRRAALGPGCKRWIELEPRGWVCDRHVEPNPRQPRVRELPRLDPGGLTPGTYGTVKSGKVRLYPTARQARWHRGGRRAEGALTIRQAAERRVGRRNFWRTEEGSWVDARKVREHRPSDFVGVRLDPEDPVSLPLGWTVRAGAPGKRIPVRAVPMSSAAPRFHLPPRTVLQLLESSPDGSAHRVGDGAWVESADLRVARLALPPAGIGPDERWIDVDLAEQVLVAYEGERPVYATLIASGGPEHPTPGGLFRIRVKFSEKDMRGSGDAPYHVETVPWTMFFFGDLALHAAYWHDGFGEPRSHGCVNLAPRDARELYLWAAPRVPDGWTMVWTGPEEPGSLVRIRSGP